MVVKAKRAIDGSKVAIKHIKVDHESQYELIKILREVEIMQFLNDQGPQSSRMHMFFAGLQDLFCPKKEQEQHQVRNLFLVMPLADNNLDFILKNKLLTPLTAKVILYNLLCSLKYLHSSNIMHRDLKPHNILVSVNSQVRICDFGLARTLPPGLLGKHNGQSSRVRHSVLTKFTGLETEEEKRELIVKKVSLIQKQAPT